MSGYNTGYFTGWEKMAVKSADSHGVLLGCWLFDMLGAMGNKNKTLGNRMGAHGIMERPVHVYASDIVVTTGGTPHAPMPAARGDAERVVAIDSSLDAELRRM